MFRVIIFFLCITCTSFCSSLQLDVSNIEQSDAQIAITYVALGNIKLLNKNFNGALDDFKKAETILESAANYLPDLGFLVFFGETVAYDNLAETNFCQQSLDSLYFIIYEQEDGQDERILEDFNIEETQESVIFLRKIGGLAKSPYVQACLLSVVDKMEEALLPKCMPAYLTDTPIPKWQFDYGNTWEYKKCGRFWRNFGRIMQKVKRWVMIAIEIYEIVDKVSNNENGK